VKRHWGRLSTWVNYLPWLGGPHQPPSAHTSTAAKNDDNDDDDDDDDDDDNNNNPTVNVSVDDTEWDGYMQKDGGLDARYMQGRVVRCEHCYRPL
jgi:hypothetical protein